MLRPRTKTGRTGPRSKNGCWTCRFRKVKCDEARPECNNCSDRALDCDYAPRPKSTRRRARSRVTLTPQLPAKVANIAPAIASSAHSSPTNTQSLPLGLTVQDWPVALTSRDRLAIFHYAEDVVPRMSLRTPRWSSYAYVLRMCSKHALLAHLILAFSLRDMANDNDSEFLLGAIEHYQKGLAMFIEHLGSPERQGWITFPALWLFIHYEQQYGEDPRDLQKHLEGVRDVVASHGANILPGTIGGQKMANVTDHIEIPHQMIDRLALWTIYHDSHASTFGFGGGLIPLLKEKYPGSIDRITESSSFSIKSAWGPSYPPVEELWDIQLRPLETVIHHVHILRYELSTVHQMETTSDAVKAIEIGYELRRIEEEYSSLLSQGLSHQIERSTISSNKCAAAANFFALVASYERLVYKTLPKSTLSKIMRACGLLFRYEGKDYMWRVAWPMFVVGVETDDLIYQSWIMERFSALSRSGENMQRAKALLERLFLEKQTNQEPIDYLAWTREGSLKGFVV